MKKCKRCGEKVCKSHPRVIITTGKFPRRKRTAYHLDCYISERKASKA